MGEGTGWQRKQQDRVRQAEDQSLTSLALELGGEGGRRDVDELWLVLHLKVVF